MSTSLVSVIMPAYNVEKFIGEAIQSVLNQTYPYWEMLVVDDGSTDGTRACIESYLSDSRIVYFHQENQERAVARNNGIRRASGKYIAFLDADDVWLPDKLHHQVELLETHPELGLCFTDCKYVDNLGVPFYTPNVGPFFGGDMFRRLLEGNFILNSTVMMPRFIFDRVGLFNETLPAFGCEDWDMWLKVTRHYPIHFINQPLAFYRRHQDNTHLDSMYLSQEAVLQCVFSDPTLPEDVDKNKARIYALSNFKHSERCSYFHQRSQAIKYWRRAVKIYPQGLLTTQQGISSMLRLLLPYPLISNLRRLKRLLSAS